MRTKYLAEVGNQSRLCVSAQTCFGTVCRPIQNSGFVTSLNHGLERSLEETVATYAHEVAHNFNANHDDELEKSENEDINKYFDVNCTHGNYIMSGDYDLKACESRMS